MALDNRKRTLYKGAKHTIRFTYTNLKTKERIDLNGATINVYMELEDGGTFDASTTNSKVSIIEKGIFDMTLEIADTALLKDGDSQDIEVIITWATDTDIIQKEGGLIVKERLFEVP